MMYNIQLHGHLKRNYHCLLLNESDFRSLCTLLRDEGVHSGRKCSFSKSLQTQGTLNSQHLMECSR